MATSDITLSEISKTIGARVLFSGVSAVFTAGNRYGLTGPNGAGKSTLLKIMVGIEDATAGSISLPAKVGFLRQNIDEYKKYRTLDVVIMGNTRLWEALAERDMLYEKEMTDAIGMRLGEIEEVIAEEDGYSADSEAELLLTGMGISEEYHAKNLGSLPSDIQFRVLLCQALFGNPDALLLDEPTNHLDLKSIGWLEDFLMKFQGIVIVVSHDRHFLNAITTHIADIDYDTLLIYPGNYDAMIVNKTSMKERAEADSKSKEKKIAQLQEFVARFGAGTRASQVQSRIREIGRLQPQDLKKSNIQRPYIRFPVSTDKQPGKIVISASHLEKSFDHLVISDFSIEISRGEKVGIIGNNGIGKTTLLKMLATVLSPDKGKVELGHQVTIGYFPQNHGEVVDKSQQITLFDWLKMKKPKAYDQEIRGVLGKLLFSGDDAFKQISKLSGGETARLILAYLMLEEFNVLIVDEPNNHLDLEAVSALAVGLSEFPGTVIVVSHDRDLIGTVAQNKVISLEPGKIEVFDGSLEEYLSCKR